MKPTIVNRSAWPDWFVKPVCRWIVSRAGLERDYKIILPSYGNRSCFCGRGGSRSQRSRINRRFQPPKGFPHTTKYWRYKWSFSYELHNRLEAFVDIVSHEAFHATGGHPSNFTRGGRLDAASMEMACERFSRDTVAAFRDEWRNRLRAVVKAGARKARQRKVVSRTVKSDPTLKLTAAQVRLIDWQRRMKRAANKVKKYARQVRYYEGRLAAKAGA